MKGAVHPVLAAVQEATKKGMGITLVWEPEQEKKAPVPTVPEMFIGLMVRDGYFEWVDDTAFTETQRLIYGYARKLKEGDEKLDMVNIGHEIYADGKDIYAELAESTDCVAGIKNHAEKFRYAAEKLGAVA